MSLRGELDEATWEEIDGWHVLHDRGHTAKVRREAPNRFHILVDGSPYAAPVFPDDLTTVKKALEGVLRKL